MSPSPKQKYVVEQANECRTYWFKEHEANIIGGPNVFPDAILINWQKPGTWNYGCRYILHRRWLICVGDIGEAIFEWGQDITPAFLLSLNFDYFMGKCQASPEGRKFEQWDTNVLEAYRLERLAELRKNIGTDDESETDKAELELLEGNSKCSKDEWEAVVRDYYDETGDAEGASSISDMGVVPSVHAIGMFVGLQMAITQLKEKGLV